MAVSGGGRGTWVARRHRLTRRSERKASLLIDAARAFQQGGKHQNAYLALRAARDIAPKEIAGRPAVHQLVRDIITSAPPGIQRQAEQFADRLGVAR